MRINFLNYGGVQKCTRDAMLEVMEKALNMLGQPSKMEINVAFVSPDEIKVVNGKERGKNEPTDVLSFPAFDLKPLEKVDLKEDKYKWNINPENDYFVLGDMLLCKDFAKKQAETLRHSLKEELVRLSLHSLLHCLGYDHIKDEDYEIMHKVELAVLDALGYKNLD